MKFLVNPMKKILPIACIAGAALSSCGNGSDTSSATPSTVQDCAYSNIMTRTSVRQYSDKSISRATLDSIVAAGMAAPTAMNKQPWQFIVVDDSVKLKEIAALAAPWNAVGRAKAAIIVCGDMSKAIPGDGQAYWIQDCSAASENILLAAHALGIGAVWCGVYPVAERVESMKDYFMLGADITPLNVIALGYPEKNQEPKDKYNPDNVHYNEW